MRRRKLGDELAVIRRRRRSRRSRGCARRGPCRCRESRAAPARRACASCVRMVGDDVGAVAVRADLERVVVLDLEEIGDLPQDARDRRVIQPAGLPSRCGSRARARRRRRARAAIAGRARRRAVAEQTAAAAGAADLGGGRAGGRRARDQVVDRRRRDAGREPLAVVPLHGDLPADLVPVAALERRRASPTAVSRMRSKQSKMWRSPSRWRLVISQLFVPEFRGAPV